MSISCRRHAYYLVVAGLSLFLAGCAKVTVRKVPMPTQYAAWSDRMQKQADSIQGIRFYLPRPFVNVFESFPVRTDIAIADGFVSPDGKFVNISRVRGSGGLANVFNAGTIQVPTDKILVEESAEKGEKARPEAKIGGSQPGTTVATGAEVPANTAPAPVEPPPPPVRTGVNEQTSTNNNNAFAYQPMRGSMDVVYLPDFEEQFAVNSSAGLGNAKFQVNLGQGWSLQGFNALTDNSEINKRIFDLLDTAATAAKSAVNAASGNLTSLIAGLAKQTPADATGGKRANPQGKVSTMSGVPNTPVSLKIVLVHYAAKGLYPVIKPRELQERLTSSKSTGGFLHFLDLTSALRPRVENFTTYDPQALQRAQAAANAGSFTAPRYPYQYISFNTFSYLAIEVIKTDADPFKTLYSATGTQGVSGSRTDEELLHMLETLYKTPGITTPVGPGPTQPPPPSDCGEMTPQETSQFVAAFSEKIKAKAYPASGNPYTITEPKLKGTKCKATLTAELGFDTTVKPNVDESTAREEFEKKAKEVESGSIKVESLQFGNIPGDPAQLVGFHEKILKLKTRRSGVAGAQAKSYQVKSAFTTIDAQKAVTVKIELKLLDVDDATLTEGDDLEADLLEQINAFPKKPEAIKKVTRVETDIK